MDIDAQLKPSAGPAITAALMRKPMIALLLWRMSNKKDNEQM